MGSHWFATAVLIGSHFTDKSQWTNQQLCCMYFMTTGIITAITDKPFTTLTVSFPWLSHQNIQWGADFVMAISLFLNGFTWCIQAIWFHIIHDHVIKWKHFLRYWSFVRGIHRSPVNSPHKGQWCRALMFSLICAWINAWVKNREPGDLRRHHTHYGIIVMYLPTSTHHHMSDKLWEDVCRRFPSLLHGIIAPKV